MALIPCVHGRHWRLKSLILGTTVPTHSEIRGMGKAMWVKFLMVKMVSFWGGARAQLAAHPAVAQFLLDNAANVERASDASGVGSMQTTYRWETLEWITVDTRFLNASSPTLECLPGAAARNMRRECRPFWSFLRFLCKLWFLRVGWNRIVLRTTLCSVMHMYNMMWLLMSADEIKILHQLYGTGFPHWISKRQFMEGIWIRQIPGSKNLDSWVIATCHGHRSWWWHQCHGSPSGKCEGLRSD